MKESAIGPHKTATSDAPWDGPAAEAAIPEDATATDLAHAFAWVDDAGNADTKAAYKFIHHEISADGKVGPANIKALQSAIGVLNGGMGGAKIPAADRAGVYKHLAAHLKDAGLEAPGLAGSEPTPPADGAEPKPGEPKPGDTPPAPQAEAADPVAGAHEAMNAALDTADAALEDLAAAIGDSPDAAEALAGIAEHLAGAREATAECIAAYKPADKPADAKPGDQAPAGSGEPPAGHPMPMANAAAEAFPKSREMLETLGAAMLANPAFAAEVHRVSEALAPRELEGAFVSVQEQALRADGSAAIRLITPGWGSSGYYAPAMLERDGGQVFKAGTKMFWNHPTAAEEADRPEGDLRNLAGELLTDATWQESGPDGPGLYADAKIFDPFKGLVDQLAPHIGVSIRAMGKASTGTAEGRSGPIIDGLTAAHSVDFVTAPGAGGKVLQLFESAAPPRPDQGDDELSQAERTELAEARSTIAGLEAKGTIRERLAATKLPEAAQRKISEAIAAELPMTEDHKLDPEALEAELDEAIKSETAYLVEAGTAGKITGHGSTEPGSGSEPEKAQAKLAAAFAGMGLAESTAKIAAAGR